MEGIVVSYKPMMIKFSVSRENFTFTPEINEMQVNEILEVRVLGQKNIACICYMHGYMKGKYWLNGIPLQDYQAFSLWSP